MTTSNHHMRDDGPGRPGAGTQASIVTIDCDGCPVRGRHCDDCFVPVLGRTWLGTPAAPPHPAGPGTPQPATGTLAASAARPTAALDSDELGAVAAFVRAGLVTPEEAAGARALIGAVPGRAAG